MEPRIGDVLVEMKACTAQELQAALQTQAIFGGRIGTNLLELGLVDERQLGAALSRVHGIPCVGNDVEPEEDAIAAVSPELVERLGIVPLHTDDRHLRVAVMDPGNLACLDDLAFATGKNVEPVVAPEARVWSLMRRFYGIDKKLRGLDVEDDLEVSPGREAALATARGSGEGGRILSHDDALKLMQRMSDPVVLGALLVRGAASSVGRAVFLKSRGRRAVAWLGAGRFLSGDVRGAQVLITSGTLFGDAVELRAPVLAPVHASKATAKFFEALGGPLPMNALIAPIVLRGRAVALLYADLGPGGTLRKEAIRLLELTAALNARLETISPISPS